SFAPSPQQPHRIFFSLTTIMITCVGNWGGVGGGCRTRDDCCSAGERYVYKQAK
ncbi:hypothetical protein BDZ91DRAFT_734019, partial [Kalaharituber pfeilii]